MIRLARIEDLDQVVEVINDAKALFRLDGSDQWQDTDNYPNYDTMLKDLERKELYVNIKDDVIVGCIVLSSIHEEAYDNIYDGSWLTNGEYLVIHRLAVRDGWYKKGIAKELMEYVINLSKIKKVSSIRVDTKMENTRMLNLLYKFNFKLVGKIDLLRNDVLDKVRLAFELKM